MNKKPAINSLLATKQIKFCGGVDLVDEGIFPRIFRNLKDISFLGKDDSV